MRKEKSFTVGDKDLTAYELTVKQITQIMESLDSPEEAEINDIDLLFPDRVPSSAVAMSLDMKPEELAEYAPSEIEIMLDAVEEINPTFASLMERLAKVGRQALESQKSGEQPAG